MTLLAQFRLSPPWLVLLVGFSAAFVGNLTSSYRAPALEELYNPTAAPF